MSDNIHVLTVDDSASMRALLRAALSSRGYNVSQAEDGVAALEWLQDNGSEVDVIVTDINMPRMDGFGLIEALREQTRLPHSGPVHRKLRREEGPRPLRRCDRMDREAFRRRETGHGPAPGHALT